MMMVSTPLLAIVITICLSAIPLGGAAIDTRNYNSVLEPTSIRDSAVQSNLDMQSTVSFLKSISGDVKPHPHASIGGLDKAIHGVTVIGKVWLEAVNESCFIVSGLHFVCWLCVLTLSAGCFGVFVVASTRHVGKTRTQDCDMSLSKELEELTTSSPSHSFGMWVRVRLGRQHESPDTNPISLSASFEHKYGGTCPSTQFLRHTSGLGAQSKKAVYGHHLGPTKQQCHAATEALDITTCGARVAVQGNVLVPDKVQHSAFAQATFDSQWDDIDINSGWDDTGSTGVSLHVHESERDLSPSKRAGFRGSQAISKARRAQPKDQSHSSATHEVGCDTRVRSDDTRDEGVSVVSKECRNISISRRASSRRSSSTSHVLSAKATFRDSTQQTPGLQDLQHSPLDSNLGSSDGDLMEPPSARKCAADRWNIQLRSTFGTPGRPLATRITFGSEPPGGYLARRFVQEAASKNH